MRVAILTTYFYRSTKEYNGEDRIIYGGGERYLYELCRLLCDEGHQVTVYQLLPAKNTEVKKEYTVVEKEFKGIKIKCLPGEERGEFGTAPNLNSLFNEMEVLADLRIYFVTSLAWPEVRLPAISVSHGIFWDFPGHFYRLIPLDQRQEFFRRHLYGFTAPDACVAVDTNVRNVVAALEPGAENKTHVIANFVDTGVFKPPAHKDWEKPRVLFPRRLTPVRGMNDFIKMTREFPEVEFLVCGNAKIKETEEQLKQLFQLRNNNIRAIWRPMDQMAEIYQQADLAVVPTRACEGTSLSCLEAMAAGLPVIATPVGGLPNLIIDGWNGHLVDLNNETLAPVLRRLLESPETMRKFGERNRQIAVEAFDLNIWRKKWKELLAKVI